MIQKLIFTALFISSLSYGSVQETLHTKPSLAQASIKKTVWTPSIQAKKSGKSCDDGNCLTSGNCMTKDGMMYKMFASVGNEMKRFIKKL